MSDEATPSDAEPNQTSTWWPSWADRPSSRPSPSALSLSLSVAGSGDTSSAARRARCRRPLGKFAVGARRDVSTCRDCAAVRRRLLWQSVQSRYVTDWLTDWRTNALTDMLQQLLMGMGGRKEGVLSVKLIDPIYTADRCFELFSFYLSVLCLRDAAI